MRYVVAGIAVVLVLLVVVLAQQSNNQSLRPDQSPRTEPTKDQAGDPQAAATQALSTLRELVDDQNFRELGFESREEAANATLGEPLRVYLVRLDQLRDYRAETDPNKLLNDTNQIIYPVKVRDQVRSSIVLGVENGKWSANSFGGAGLAQQLTKTRDNDMRASNQPPASYSAIKVPALNVYFVARRGEAPGGDLTVIPLYDQPDFRMKEGGAIPAKEAFAALVPAARAHDGKTS